MLPNSSTNKSMATSTRRDMNRKTTRRGSGKRVVQGKDLRLADEVRYIQKRAADHDARIITLGPLVLFSTETGDVLYRNRRCLAARPCRSPRAEAPPRR